MHFGLDAHADVSFSAIKDTLPAADRRGNTDHTRNAKLPACRSQTAMADAQDYE
jgi:hypothetical protein